MSTENKIITTEWVRHNSLLLQNDNGDTLSFVTRDGRPRLVVDYKLTLQEKQSTELSLEDKSVTAPFSLLEFESFVDLTRLILEDKTPSISVMCLYHYDKHGKKSEDKLERTLVTVFKDTDDVYKISLKDVMYNDKETIFKLIPSSWFVFKIGSQLVPEKLLSKMFFKRYISSIDRIVENIHKINNRKTVSQREALPVKMEIVKTEETTAV